MNIFDTFMQFFNIFCVCLGLTIVIFNAAGVMNYFLTSTSKGENKISYNIKMLGLHLFGIFFGFFAVFTALINIFDWDVF